MNEPAIAVRHLTRTFGAHDVLRDVSLDVREGEVFALQGANGSGKTTFLEILATVLLPTSGTARIQGLDVVNDAAAVRRLIGYGVSSLHSFYPRLTGDQNLGFFGTLNGLSGRVLRARVGALLEQLDLAGAARQRVEQYSDGMKARLCIARALLADPPVLLLDEPSKCLDPAGRARVRELVLAPAGGRPRTVIWVTHDHREAAEVANRTGNLSNGSIAQVQVAAS
jgi:ABC-2 type transport system ATP-binding protein